MRREKGIAEAEHSRRKQKESRGLPYHGHFEINDDGVEDGDPQHESDQFVLFHAFIRVPVGI